MSDAKPRGISWESFTERRIREAIERGEFDHLPGCGAPIPGLDEPYDECWCIKRKLRDEGLSIVPPVLEARRAIEVTREAIRQMGCEQTVRQRLEELNRQIHQAHMSAIAGPPDGVLPVDIEAELAAWRRDQPDATGG